MDIKRLPLRLVTIVALSSMLLMACDDARIRTSSNIGSGHNSGHGVSIVTHTPHNHRVSYDNVVGMYVVAGLLNTYWNGSNYYRYNNLGWQRSSDYRRWNNVRTTHVPGRLQRRHFRHGRRHNGGRHNRRLIGY